MREIKFRAWIKPEDCSDGLMSYEDSHDDIIMISNGNGFTIVENDYYLPDDRFEIMQFTGLKDKEGTEVYEGDVVIWPHLDSEGYYEIYFNEKELHYSARPLTIHDEIDSWIDSTHMKVIGTIFDEKYNKLVKS